MNLYICIDRGSGHGQKNPLAKNFNVKGNPFYLLYGQFMQVSKAL